MQMPYRYLLVLVLVSMGIVPFQSVAGQTCGLNYQLLTNSGTVYGLVGMYNFNGLPNQTSVIVTGKLLPYNSSAFIHPTPSYGGTILVLLLQSTATTLSWYSITIVEISNSTWTTTQVNNPAPTSQTVTLEGTIVTHYGNCVQPFVVNSQSNENVPIAVVGGVILIAIILMAAKRKRK